MSRGGMCDPAISDVTDNVTGDLQEQGQWPMLQIAWMPNPPLLRCFTKSKFHLNSDLVVASSTYLLPATCRLDCSSEEAKGRAQCRDKRPRAFLHVEGIRRRKTGGGFFQLKRWVKSRCLEREGILINGRKWSTKKKIRMRCSSYLEMKQTILNVLEEEGRGGQRRLGSSQRRDFAENVVEM